MRKRGLCCRPVSVCPSVRPSVCRSRTHVLVLYQKAGDIVKQPGGPIILVFLIQAPVSNSKNSFSGGAKYTGVGKIEIVVYLAETVRNRPMVAMER